MDSKYEKINTNNCQHVLSIYHMLDPMLSAPHIIAYSYYKKKKATHSHFTDEF